MVRYQERTKRHHRRKEIGLDADVPIVDPYQEEKQKPPQPICVKKKVHFLQKRLYCMDCVPQSVTVTVNGHRLKEALRETKRGKWGTSTP